MTKTFPEISAAVRLIVNLVRYQQGRIKVFGSSALQFLECLPESSKTVGNDGSDSAATFAARC